MTKDEILNNQALSQHMLFFSPLNKHAVFEKGGIHYEDQAPGVRALDYGRAEFSFPPTEAETVTVKGWGGSMQGEYALQRQPGGRRTGIGAARRRTCCPASTTATFSWTGCAR